MQRSELEKVIKERDIAWVVWILCNRLLTTHGRQRTTDTGQYLTQIAHSEPFILKQPPILVFVASVVIVATSGHFTFYIFNFLLFLAEP